MSGLAFWTKCARVLKFLGRFGMSTRTIPPVTYVLWPIAVFMTSRICIWSGGCQPFLLESLFSLSPGTAIYFAFGSGERCVLVSFVLFGISSAVNKQNKQIADDRTSERVSKNWESTDPFEERFALWLRPFQSDDKLSIATHVNLNGTHFMPPALWKQPGLFGGGSEDIDLAELFRNRCEMGLSFLTGQEFQVPGGGGVQLTDERWQEQVGRAIETAALVIFMPGAGRAMDWELQHLLKKNRMQKTLVFLPVFKTYLDPAEIAAFGGQSELRAEFEFMRLHSDSTDMATRLTTDARVQLQRAKMEVPNVTEGPLLLAYGPDRKLRERLSIFANAWEFEAFLERNIDGLAIAKAKEAHFKAMIAKG